MIGDVSVSAGVFTASGEDMLDFTADRGKLTETIEGLKPHPRFSDQACPPMTAYQAYRIAQNRDQETIGVVVTESSLRRCPTTRSEVTARAENVWRQSLAISLQTLGSVDRAVARLGGIEGERVLVLVSSGFTGQTLETQQDQIIAHAVGSGVTINALVTQGVYNELMPGERFEDERPEHVVDTLSRRYQRWVKAEIAETNVTRPFIFKIA